MGATESIRFYRNELERQRDFHRGWWFWSRLVIFLPGPVIFLVSVALTFPQAATFVWLELAAFVFFVSTAVPLNLRLARKLPAPNRSAGCIAQELRRPAHAAIVIDSCLR